jgi:hypothetical protein
MGDTSSALRGRIRQQVAALGPRGVTSRVPDALRATIVDYTRERQAAGVGWLMIAREVGFSIGAIRGWARAAAGAPRLRPVAVRGATVVTLPAPGVVVVLPSGIRQIVTDWVTYLKEVELWGNDDPLFPATHIIVGAARQFEVAGLKRAHWSSAAPIRTIFREAFEAAGLPYFNPHSLRSTLVRLGEALCQTPEEFKAWSQNLGHEGVLTTFYSYGAVGNRRQGEIIGSLGQPQERERSDADEIAEAVLRKLSRSGHAVYARGDANAVAGPDESR